VQVNTDELLSKVQQDIQNAESFYQSQIEPKVKERYQLYNADPDYYAKKFPKLAELNSFTSTDVADQIEWAMPSLMRIFFGGQDVIVVKGRTVEDDRSAEIMQKLINWQIQRQNPGFMIFYRWFKDALITGLGIIKAYWVREFEERKFNQVVGIDEYLAAKDDPAIEIIEAKTLENGMIDLTFKVKLLSKNQPILENIPASEFIFNPNAKRIEESPFVAHRKLVTADYLLRRAKDGWYDEQKVRELLEEGDNGASFISSVDPSLMPSKNFMVNQPDDARRNFTLYECYTKYDINGDGLLEDVIVTVVGNKILRVVENIYKRPPFFVLTPILEPYQIWGKGFGDVLKDVQDIKTAIIRQIIVNIGLNNDPKVFVDGSKVDLNDLSSGSSYIRVDGNPQQAIQPFPVRPLAPWTYNFLEYWEGIKENRTGITRYNQGLDARSLNKTATGIQLIMQAANQRLELIARIFAETGVKDLFRFLVELNQRFIDQATVIRLTNEPLVIRPDDLKGEFDLVIEAGVGVGAKEQMLQNLKEIMSMYPQLMQLGLATPKNLYEVVKRYFQLLGFKAVDKLLTEPQMQQGGQLGVLQQAGGENPALAGAIQEDASPRAVLERALEAYQRMQGGPIQGVAGESEGEVGADTLGTQSPPEVGNSPEQGY